MEAVSKIYLELSSNFKLWRLNLDMKSVSDSGYVLAGGQNLAGKCHERVD